MPTTAASGTRAANSTSRESRAESGRRRRACVRFAVWWLAMPEYLVSRMVACAGRVLTHPHASSRILVGRDKPCESSVDTAVGRYSGHVENSTGAKHLERV